MAIIKCKMCGGDIELAPDKTFGTCEYCGSTMTLPKIDDEQRAAAFNRGNHFRRIGEFDKALSVYERIVQEDENDAEAHWCCALCRFGIEYVEDPTTFEWLPTCHRLSFDSFLEDVDYLAALEHSDGITRRQYQKDGAKIAEVQRGILATSQNTEPYDVFICYKETDENNQRTRDSILAQDIYYQLTEQGRRVFFARITLEDVPGAEYEPYIFAALNSAKVMVVVGTSGENLSAVWVKNEWSRFLALMKKDRSKLLIPCFRDMDPYDLPEQLSVLQSYDMGKIGFIQDLLRGVGKVLDAGKKPEVKETVIVQQQGGTNVEALLKRGQMALEDGDWAKADGFFEEVLNQDAENARAYIGKALVEEKQPSLEKLAQARLDRTQNAKAEKLMIPADETHAAEAVKLAIPDYYESSEIQKAYLNFDLSYPSHVKGRESQCRNEEPWWQQHKQLSRAASFARGEEKAELENARNRVLNEMASRIKEAQAQENAAEADVKERYAAFLEETDAKVREKVAQAQEQRESNYQYYKNKVETSDSTEQLQNAVAFLIKLSGYKDTDALIKLAQERIDVIKVEEARIRAEKEAEEARIRAEEEAKAAKRRAEEKRKATKKTIIIGLVSAIAVIAVIAVILVITKVVIPGQKYKAAEALLAAGDKAHAAMAFYELDSYSDAKERSFSVWSEITTRETVSAGYDHTVGLKADGTVVATEYIGEYFAGEYFGDHYEGQCEVYGWTDIVEISAGGSHTVGLKADGTVVAAGRNEESQCEVSGWTDIVEISAGGNYTVGLKDDGTVVAVGDNDSGQCEVSGWTDIVDISAGGSYTVGLKADGTVVATRYIGSDTYYGQCDVSDWADIVAVSAGGTNTVGLKADGTVVSTEYTEDYFKYFHYQCNVSGWTDIVAVSAAWDHTVGVKSDGTVVAVGSNYDGQCEVNDWTDIVAVSAEEFYTVGLKSDGTVVATDASSEFYFGQSDVSGFRNIKQP